MPCPRKNCFTSKSCSRLKPFCEFAGKLSKHLEVCCAINYGHFINGVVNFVELHAVYGDGVVVVRKFLYEGASRRYDYGKGTVRVAGEEYTVVIEVID